MKKSQCEFFSQTTFINMDEPDVNDFIYTIPDDHEPSIKEDESGSENEDNQVCSYS